MSASRTHQDGALRDAVIADDLQLNRRVLQAHLERLGFACRHAANGREAVALCREKRPDVALLDVVMPEMDGLDAAAAIRALPKCADLPIVLLTGLASDDVAARARAVNATAVLEKPATPVSLRSVLRRAVGPQVRAANGSPTRVLVVDDSAMVRGLLTEILDAEPALEVVGAARDANRAWQKIQKLAPDVITLDVEMPGMDGLTFLERLMRLRPMPVVMISSLTERGSRETIRALELGAVDFVAKPKVDLRAGTHAMAAAIVAKVRTAARARIPAAPREPIPPARSHGYTGGADTVIAIGASTGGPKALTGLLGALPEALPPVLIVQHMPESFTRSFAARLDTRTPLHVCEAQGGEQLQPGRVYVAPGHSHMVVRRERGALVTRLDASDPVNRHRPSVDVLFRSLVRLKGVRTIAALLTGMGADGAEGLAELRANGAITIAQDEATSLVYGMPRVAAELGAAMHILPLRRVPGALVKLAARAARRRTA